MNRSRRRHDRRPPSGTWLLGAVWLLDHWREATLLAVAAWTFRHWRGLAVLLVSAAVGVWASSWQLALVTLILLTYLLTRRKSRRGSKWWHHDVLAPAMVSAGILRAPKEGERSRSLSYRGKPVHTDHGTTVIVGLPDARTLTDVATRREALAAALRVPSALLEVHQEKGDPANVVRLHVTSGKRTETPATVATAPSTVWREPVRIGCDSRGEPVHLASFEHNSLVAGRPGSGKTALSRILLAHFLLDPTTSVYLLDGKGSTDDYGACRPLCARFVSGVDEDAVDDTLALLGDVLAIVRARNAAGGQHPGALVLLEELQDVRAAATREERDRLDTLLGRIVRMGRAVGVHVIISTQRPTADDLPAGTRNLLSQRIALMLRNGADAALVLGHSPALALPEKRGEALFTDGGPVRGVVLDRLTDDAWRQVCKRATALRASQTPLALEPGAARFPESVTTAPAPVDPVLDAVLSVLADADPRGLPAAELHNRLPDWARSACPSPRDLGVTLARHPGLVERAHIGSTRVWKAPGVSGLTPGVPPAAPAVTPGGPTVHLR